MSPQPTIPFHERARWYGDLVCSFVQRAGQVLLLSEMHGTIGDHLIWAGTERLLGSRRVSYDRLPVPILAQESDQWIGGTLVVPGSDAWTARRHEWLPHLVHKASRIVDRVVVLPSSYDASVPVVVEALSQPNIHAFCREHDSYRRVKALGRVALALDPALYAMDFEAPGADPEGDTFEGSALVALRTDKDSLLGERGWTPTVGMNNDLSVTAVNLDDFMEKIRGCAVVVTDRLSVVVAAVMLGKRVNYLDPYDLRISTYVDFVFRDEFGHQLIKRSENWLAARGFIERVKGQ